MLLRNSDARIAGHSPGRSVTRPSLSTAELTPAASPTLDFSDETERGPIRKRTSSEVAAILLLSSSRASRPSRSVGQRGEREEKEGGAAVAKVLLSAVGRWLPRARS